MIIISVKIIQVL